MTDAVPNPFGNELVFVVKWTHGKACHARSIHGGLLKNHDACCNEETVFTAPDEAQRAMTALLGREDVCSVSMVERTKAFQIQVMARMAGKIR